MQKIIALAIALLAAPALVAQSPGCPPIVPGMNVYITFGAPNCGMMGTPCPPGETLLFTAATYNFDFSCSAYTFHWDFGDGTTADAKDVAHAYALPGNYAAKLTVTGANGTPAVMEQVVRIDPAVATTVPLPFDFTIAPMIVLGAVPRNAYTFTAVPASDASTVFFWDFGDGIAAVASGRVSHTYADASPHLVTMTAVGYTGAVQHLVATHHRTARH